MIKHFYKYFGCFLIPYTLYLIPCSAQGTWVQKANVGGIARAAAFGFSIGNKGYIGTGGDLNWTYQQDFWEWDQATDSWTQKANYGGGTIGWSDCFSIGGKGYVCAGLGTLTSQNELWAYDPLINGWTQLANLPGPGRCYATSFSIGNKGYICSGSSPASVALSDLWEYDVPANSWVQRASFPGSSRYCSSGFSIGSKGYLMAGHRSSPNLDFQDLWEWDEVTNTWTQKANMPGPPRGDGVGFSIGNFGYFGTGITISMLSTVYSDFWQYDAVANSWTQMANFGGGLRDCAVGFTIGCKGYLGTGTVGLNGHKNDFWEFIPSQLTTSVSAISNVDCFGNNSGGAAINVSNGTPAYTYFWNSIPAQTTQNATGLYAGTYTVTVTDGSGCTTIDTFLHYFSIRIDSITPCYYQCGLLWK